MLTLIKNILLPTLFLAAFGLPNAMMAQNPEVEIRQVKPLQDGTAAIKINVTLRNQSEVPFIFSYFERPEQVYVQQTGFVTKIHLEEYEGSLEPMPCGEWTAEPSVADKMRQIAIQPGDILFADYVYRVDPENSFEVILPSGHRFPFTQLISHLSLSFGNAQAYQELIPTQIPNCDTPRSQEGLRQDDLLELRNKIHNLQTKILRLGKDASQSYI
jgi:hypothetical protein